MVITLWLWKMLHDTSCLALTMPSALGMATTYGLLQYHLQRRRWLLSCCLTDGSGLRRLLWRPRLTTARCLFTALPLTVVLAVFVAFADPAEWYMLLATGVLVPVLAVAARAWPGSHFRDRSTDVDPVAAPRNILTTRIAGTTCLAVGLTGCVRPWRPAGAAGSGTPTRSARAGWQVRQFMMLGAGIAIIGLVAGASYYEGLEPDRAIEHPAPAPLPVRPCDWVREIDLQQRAARWWAAVEASLRNAPLTDTQTTMSDGVDEAFAPAYDRIPEFLDWHYSGPSWTWCPEQRQRGESQAAGRTGRRSTRTPTRRCSTQRSRRGSAA